MTTNITITCLLLWAAVAPTSAKLGPRIGSDKKIVHYFQYWPDAKYLRENVRKVEELPFDGIAIWPTAEVDGEREKIWFRWFNPERIPESMVADTIRDLKATTFEKFTDNFLQMASQCGPLPAPDWGDDEAWEKITANMALAARICRECKLKGIMLDVENYNPPKECPYKFRFNYFYARTEERKLLEGGLIDRVHTWEEAAAAARQRGRQIMRAMCQEYPGITLISIAGLHDIAKRSIDPDLEAGPGSDLQGLAVGTYGLLAPFADGLLEGASRKATLVDGCESAYAYKLNQSFVEARQRIRRAHDVSAIPSIYKKKAQVAFGLMLDYDYSSRGWHTDPKDFSRNHFTPIDFGNALYFAMLNSDRYVWVYSELDGATFLENVYGYWQDPKEHAKPTVHEDYLRAMERAREPRDLDSG